MSYEGTRGLVPVVEAAWVLPVKLQDVGDVGELLDVLVKRVEAGHFVASVKDCYPERNPWIKALELKLGQVVKGVVSRVVGFAVFVEVCRGVEALLEGDSATGLAAGQSVEVEIVDIDYESQKIRVEMV